MQQIVVIGDVMLDETVFVTELEKITPEDWRRPRVRSNAQTLFTLGGAANVAANCASLLTDFGGHALLFGQLPVRYPEDALSQTFNQLAGNENRFRCQRVYCPDVKMSVRRRYKTVDCEELFRVDTNFDQAGQPNMWAPGGGYYESLLSLRKWKPVFVFVSYDLGFLDKWVCEAAIPLVQDIGPFFVDPGKTPCWRNFGSPNTCFKVNLAQCRRMMFALDRDFICTFDSLAQEKEWGKLIVAVAARLRKVNIHYHALIVTLGKYGAAFVTYADEYVPGVVCGPSVIANDVCGAGDTFLAGLATYRVDNDGPITPTYLYNACTVADKCARTAVTHYGTTVVTKGML